jgi:hypothetical protein
MQLFFSARQERLLIIKCKKLFRGTDLIDCLLILLFMAHIPNVFSTKRLLDKTSPYKTSTHNASLTKRLRNETSPVTKRLRNKTSPGHFCIVLYIGCF